MVVGAIVVVSVVVVMGSAVGAIVVVVTVGSELVFGSPIVHSGELNGQSQAKEIVLKTRPFGQNVRYATPKLQTKKDEQSIGLAKVPCGSGQTNRAGVVAGGRVEEIGELSVGFGSSVGGP